MKQVVRGNSVTITGTFTIVGAATDPTTTTLEVKEPGGTITAYSDAQMTHVGTGIYAKNVIISSEGTWTFRMTGTGTVAASSITNIECRADVFV